MKIDYRETTDDLIKRIDIHDRYGSKDIDKWMLDILPLQKGQTILDIGCGAGKQCFSYYHHLEGQASITGGDVSDELLAQAIKTNHDVNDAVNFIKLDFDSPFNLSDDYFDLASCCFAIYYATDIPFTISEIHRVLKQVVTFSLPDQCRKISSYFTISSAKRLGKKFLQCLEVQGMAALF